MINCDETHNNLNAYKFGTDMIWKNQKEVEMFGEKNFKSGKIVVKIPETRIPKDCFISATEL